MSTADRPDDPVPVASDVAGRLREAGFVRLVTARTGDGVAAAGLLARALGSVDVPYQLSVAAVPDPARRETDADLTLALGRPAVDADVTLGTTRSRTASATACAIAGELGTVDPVLALAGVVAAGVYPESADGAERILERAREDGVQRRPGVAIPTTEHADGLAHSTLVHAPFSGDVTAARDALADAEIVVSRPEAPGEDARRQIASLVALTVAGEGSTTPRATVQVERFLRPLAGGPLETVGGYADVLDAVARERPGLAVSLALDTADREAALAAWRDHAERAHTAVREARTGRYDGLFVARCEAGAPVETVARLLRDFRSPEPLVLVVADGVAAAVRVPDGESNASAADHDIGRLLETTARHVDGSGGGTATRGRARFGDSVEPSEFVAAVREER